MRSAPVGEVPTVLLVSSNQSFRAHLEQWLPAPAVNVVESQGALNVRQRVEATPPMLVVVDQQLEGYAQFISELSSVTPGVPYLSVSLEHAETGEASRVESAAGWATKEYPTRASMIEAIRKVAPTVAARLD